MAYVHPDTFGKPSMSLDVSDGARTHLGNYGQRTHSDVEDYLAYEEERAEILSRASGTSLPSIAEEKKKRRGFRPKDIVKDFDSVFRSGEPQVAVLTGDGKTNLVKEIMEKEMDNLAPLLKFKARLDSLGLEFPAIQIGFKDITVKAEVFTGGRSIPSLTNAILSLGECVTGPLRAVMRANKDEKRTIHMLDNVSGCIKPGRLTLLLGAPGSGKSTLLRTLSGQMKDKTVQLSGHVTYNDVALKDFVIERTGAYIDQIDRHIAHMTVRETMAFSARMQGAGYGNDPLYDAMKEKEKDAHYEPDPALDALLEQMNYGRAGGDNIIVDLIARLLGLENCIETVVGDDLLKGISGGQKKRVTTAEMVVGRMPVYMMDEISTGLDSASTFLITQSLRNICHIFRHTVVVALLQPSPETYDIFDDVILLGEGKILYHGPREEVMPFITSLGMQKPPRKAEADFLQEVTTAEQKLYLVDKGPDAKVLSCKEIAEKFQESSVGKTRSAEMATAQVYTDLDMAQLERRKYLTSPFNMLKGCFDREALLMGRMSAFIVLRAVQSVFLAFATGTLFVQTGKDSITDANYFMSVCFFSTMFMFLGGFAEVPIFVLRLPVFYKQRDRNFYPAWAYCLAGALVRVPDNILMVTLWTVICYWTVGFTATAGQFFIHWLVLIGMYTFSTSVFRTIAALCRDTVITQAVGAAIIVVCINTTGFTLSKADIPDWWIWAYWANPQAYAIRALLVNEMNTGDWPNMMLEGETVNVGLVSLELRSYQTETWWVWIGVGALFGASFLLVFLQAILLAVLDMPAGSGTAVSDETEEVPPAVISKTSTARTASVKSAPSATAPSATAPSGAGDVEEAGKAKKTDALSFTPFTLAFRGIKYHVPKPGGQLGEELTLLKGIDGVFSPGSLTALMGASGAGKTTLMDVLAGRKTGGRTEGDQLLNGHTKNMTTFARVMGYVEQFDIHCSQATVREALMFSGKIRLPEELGNERVEAFVEEVMDLVELRPLKDALIGLPGESGLSVEQRKRLTIAVELVANPSVVFMDEPTSGLDARAASIVMRVVRNTVNTGRTVVCTIHQPSLEIFQAFDELLLLKRGGETIFFGPMGEDQVHLISHFESIPGVEKFREGYNPANWMLDVSSPGAEISLGVDFAKYYKESEAAKKCKARLEEVCEPLPDTKPLSFEAEFSVSIGKQMRLLLKRNFTTYWRSPKYNLVRMFITIFCGLIFGSLYWDIGTSLGDTLNVMNIMGVLFSSTTFLAVANAMIILPVIHNERVVFYREKASGMYSPYPFAAAQGIVELPYLVVQSAVYAVIVYFMVGFENDAAKFFWYFLFNFLNLCGITYFGMACINITPAPEFATVLVALFFTLWNLVCGFLKPQPDIQGYWIWVYWSNPISYVLYGLCASQLGDYHTNQINEASPGSPESLVPIPQYLEDVYGYKHDFIGWAAFILVAFIIFFRAISVIALFKLSFQNR